METQTVASSTAQTVTARGSMSVVTACEFVGLGRTNLYKLMNSGKLEYSLVGGKRLIPRVALERLLTDSLVSRR